jgi:hypothetical protein
MSELFYAECEYCGPLPVSGPVSPETTNRDHVFDTADAHIERSADHVVKVWQLVDTWPKRRSV